MNSDIDLVSVVIPTYNRAKIIEKCLETVINQTYKNLEIIIVDDCSTDNTEQVIKSIPDKRIRFFRLDKNRRACYARNFGADHANGKYIAFQDSDDTWSLDKIEKQVEFIKKTEADMVFCGMTRTEGEEQFYFPRYKVDTENNFLAQELVCNAISTQTILIKKEAMKIVRFDIAFKKYQDWDFGIQAAKNLKVEYMPEALAVSNILTDSISIMSSHYEAMNQIYCKYESDIEGNRNVYASCQERLGDCFRHNDSSKAREFYKKSLEINWSKKVFAKYVLSLLGIKKF